MPGVLGELLMIETVDHTFRVETKVDKLHHLKGGKQLDDVMPPLWAPVLEVLSPQGLLLSGHERLE